MRDMPQPSREHRAQAGGAGTRPEHTTEKQQVRISGRRVAIVARNRQDAFAVGGVSTASNRRRKAFAMPATISFARSLAIAALVCTPLALAQAQTRTTPAPSQAAPAKPAATNPNEERGIEQRITQLHTELKITPDQEAKWNPVAQAMRDNAANLDKLITQSKQTGSTNVSAVDDLQANQQFVQAHLEGLKNFTSAFKSLYDSMPDQQKKNADQVFAKMNRPQQGAPNRNG
jgi:hypothetical protein